MSTARLRSFLYRYDPGAGPLARDELVAETFSHGNCRLAVQYFLFKGYGIYLGADDILLPRAYDAVGEFVFKEEPIDRAVLRCGDILYAENRLNRNGEPMKRSRDAYPDRESWVLFFHSAIFLGPLTPALEPLLPQGDYPAGDLVWHSTAVDGGACIWPYAKFEHYYRPVSAKRVLPATA